MSTWHKDEESNFLYGAIRPPNWLSLGGDFRAVQTHRNTERVRERRFIVMQADLEADISNKRFSALADLATTLTNEPWRTSPLHSRFMEAGFTESQWQHSVMIVGYFNFANRCAHAMGLKIESDFTSTCN